MLLHPKLNPNPISQTLTLSQIIPLPLILTTSPEKCSASSLRNPPQNRHIVLPIELAIISKCANGLDYQ